MSWSWSSGWANAWGSSVLMRTHTRCHAWAQTHPHIDQEVSDSFIKGDHMENLLQVFKTHFLVRWFEWLLYKTGVRGMCNLFKVIWSENSCVFASQCFLPYHPAKSSPMHFFHLSVPTSFSSSPSSLLITLHGIVFVPLRFVIALLRHVYFCIESGR